MSVNCHVRIGHNLSCSPSLSTFLIVSKWMPWPPEPVFFSRAVGQKLKISFLPTSILPEPRNVGKLCYTNRTRCTSANCTALTTQLLYHHKVLLLSLPNIRTGTENTSTHIDNYARIRYIDQASQLIISFSFSLDTVQALPHELKLEHIVGTGPTSWAYAMSIPPVTYKYT